MYAVSDTQANEWVQMLQWKLVSSCAIKLVLYNQYGTCYLIVQWNPL